MRKIIIILLVFLLLASCSNKDEGNLTVTIAEQFGLAYAPLKIMKVKNYIEENLPGIKVEWIRLQNTAAIREAVLGGRVDIGFMGIPPFLIGWDKGMEWKIFTGLSSAEIGLVTWREDLTRLEDFGRADRIVLPQPGSIQHILLCMAAERIFGKADYFDNQLVTMKHPDGMNALLSRKDVAAHFTSPPYIIMELQQPGMKLVLSGKEAMGGDFTFIAGMVTDKFNKAHPDVLKAVKESVLKASSFISDNPDETVDILKKEYNVSEETLLSYLTGGSLVYSNDIDGLPEFIEFMKRTGYLSNVPKTFDEILIR